MASMKLGDVADVAGDERAGPHRLGELLEVGLVDRVGEAVGVVDDEGARGSPTAGRTGCPRSPPTGAPRRRRPGRCASPARRARRRRSARRTARRPARSRGRRRRPCACLPLAARARAATDPSSRWEKSSTPISHVSCPRRVEARASRVVVYSGCSVATALTTKPIFMRPLRSARREIAPRRGAPRRSCARRVVEVARPEERVLQHAPAMEVADERRGGQGHLPEQQGVEVAAGGQVVDELAAALAGTRRPW